MTANPQKENGNTQIANELLDAIIARHDLNGAEKSCLLFIIRKTYGWNKKDDLISISQFTKATGYNRRTICRALNTLIVTRMTLVVKTPLGVSKYGLNKHYTEWVVVKSPLVTNLVKPSDIFGKKVVVKLSPTKDTIQKTLIQKTSTASEKPKETYGNAEVSQLLDSMKKIAMVEDFKESHKQQRQWAWNLLALGRKIGKEQFAKRLNFLLKDDFHSRNCNSLRYIYANIKAFKEPITQTHYVA